MKTQILLADDEPEIHELLTPLLVRDGFTVHHAYSGDEAVRLATTQPPDLMLLDVMLPTLDGMEACREIRRTQVFPILFLSARGEELDKVLGLGVGGDDYITKPFSPEELRGCAARAYRAGHRWHHRIPLYRFAPHLPAAGVHYGEV